MNKKAEDALLHEVNTNLKKNYYLLVCAILIGFMLFAVAVTRCGISQDENQPTPVEGDKFCSDGLKVGETKEESCASGETGKKVLVCKITGQPSVIVSSTCASEPPPSCGKVTFEEDLKPVLSQNCATCHPGFGAYEVATQRIDEWVRRISLASEDPRRMPRKPNAELNQGDKDIFQAWKRDGLVRSKAECQSTNNGVTLDQDYIESELLQDIKKVDGTDREFIRWAIVSHKLNQGLEMPLGKDAVDKALNSIVEKERAITLTSYVDQKKTILRFDLRSFGLDQRDWGFIEQFDNAIDLESFTDAGKSLKLITNSRKPWLHFENLLDLLNQPRLYHFFLNIPQTEQELLKKLGVDYAADLANLDATLLGNNDSTLTSQRNRLISRHESLDGYYYKTYDTGALNGDAQRNLYAFPLLKETGSLKIFRFQASEVIFSLPNGAQAYVLFDKLGNRLNEAGLEFVRNLESQVAPAPVIQTAISCHQCHANGLNIAKDEIRAHVEAHQDEFGVNDVIRVKSLYKGQASLSAMFNVDNKRFANFLKAVGITPGSKDPINVWRDDLLFNWDENKLAAFLFLPLVKLRECVNGSETLRTAIGQILTGGYVTFDQLKEVLKRKAYNPNYPNDIQLSVLQRDCRLFQEKINGN